MATLENPDELRRVTGPSGPPAVPAVSCICFT